MRHQEEGSVLGRCTAFSFALTLMVGLNGCLSSSDSNDDNGEDISDGDSDLPELASDELLPVVFVHGGAGSAAQYRTQTMRFASNGYPRELFFAFEYPGIAPHDPDALDEFIDSVLDETDADQVHLVAHSMGTTVGVPNPDIGYLANPERAAKVDRYIGIDGATSETCPGDVPCMGIFDNDDDENVLGDNNVHLPEQEHVEVATSLESFRAQFEFLAGVEPAGGLVPAEDTVEIAGRAVHFPANTGTEGATLEIWEINAETGERLDEEPTTSYTIDTDGDWGPVSLDPETHYEMVLLREGRPDHHFYHQPFQRSTDFVRLNTSSEDSEIVANTHTGEGHSTLVVTRNKEWRGDAQDGENDTLQITTVRPDLGDQQPEVVNAITSEVGNDSIGLHIHDMEGQEEISTLELLPYFPDQPFQTGVDVYMPASTPPDGTVTLVNHPRGDAEQAQAINVPNRASSDHRMTVIFNDYVTE